MASLIVSFRGLGQWVAYSVVEVKCVDEVYDKNEEAAGNLSTHPVPLYGFASGFHDSMLTAVRYNAI